MPFAFKPIKLIPIKEIPRKAIDMIKNTQETYDDGGLGLSRCDRRGKKSS